MPQLPSQVVGVHNGTNVCISEQYISLFGHTRENRCLESSETLRITPELQKPSPSSNTNTVNLQVPTLNYFPNIIHPIDQQRAFSFVVFEITHKEKAPADSLPSTANANSSKKESASTSVDRGDLGK